MMNMESQSASTTVPPNRIPAGGTAPLFLRVGNRAVSLATDIGALEECLALERASGPSRSVPLSEGIQSPPAVPYCEFLSVRAPDGRLEAVCRLMRLDRDNPLAHPLKAGRFHLSPLLTALRYSREGILEMGVPVFAAGADPEKLARMIWTGTIRFMQRNGLGFVIGLDVLRHQPGAGEAWGRLMDVHGLHPDLEVEARSVLRSGSADSGHRFLSVPGIQEDARKEEVALESGLGNWPAGLREALRRGCRLACEPGFNAGTGCLEFVWVSSRDMLESGEPGDWRGSASTSL